MSDHQLNRPTRRDRTMSNSNIRRNLACAAVSATAALAATASPAAALNPQPLAPGHAIPISLPPDPC